jgi:hypothetical protein
MAFQDWIKRNKNVITNNETKHFKRHIATNTDPFRVFYLLMKVHERHSHPEVSSRDQAASYMPSEHGWMQSYKASLAAVLLTLKSATS